MINFLEDYGFDFVFLMMMANFV